MKRRCSRCRKVKEIIFEYERVSKQKGARELCLCAHCVKWSLMRILSSPEGTAVFELLFTEVNEISDFLQRKEKEDREHKGLASFEAQMDPSATK